MNRIDLVLLIHCRVAYRNSSLSTAKATIGASRTSPSIGIVSSTARPPVLVGDTAFLASALVVVETLAAGCVTA